jgi:hypothetical protein
MEDWVIM